MPLVEWEKEYRAVHGASETEKEKVRRARTICPDCSTEVNLLEPFVKVEQCNIRPDKWLVVFLHVKCAYAVFEPCVVEVMPDSK